MYKTNKPERVMLAFDYDENNKFLEKASEE